MAKKKKKKSSSSSYKDATYNSLTPDLQKIADLYAGTMAGTSKYSKKQLADALKKAKADSQPYMQSILRVAQTQVASDIANETGDYNSQVATINENIKEINDDLTRNRDFYTLTEQQDLQKQALSYEQQKASIIQSNAGKGLTFSSLGEQGKNVAAEQNKQMVESTTTQYNKTQADLAATAASKLFTENQASSDALRTEQYNINKTGLTAESYLGSKYLPTLPGYTPAGNVTGQFQEDVSKDIENRKEAYLSGYKQSSLNFS